MDLNSLKINKLSKQLLDITNQKGIANGIATLGTDGKIPLTQLPTSTSAEYRQFNDFMYNTSSSFTPWTSIGVLSGTLALVAGNVKHPGICSYMSSNTANSGYILRVGSSSILLGGSEKTTIIFKTGSTLAGIIRRIGFHDSLDASDATDGVYAEICDGIISGKTANNSTRSITTTTYTLASDVWYRLVIQLNANATIVTYTLYADDSSAILWQDTLSTNIPTAIGRETSHADVATYSGTTAIVLGYLDYMDIILPNARRVS